MKSSDEQNDFYDILLNLNINLNTFLFEKLPWAMMGQFCSLKPFPII